MGLQEDSKARHDEHVLEMMCTPAIQAARQNVSGSFQQQQLVPADPRSALCSCPLRLLPPFPPAAHCSGALLRSCTAAPPPRPAPPHRPHLTLTWSAWCCLLSTHGLSLRPTLPRCQHSRQRSRRLQVRGGQGHGCRHVIIKRHSTSLYGVQCRLMLLLSLLTTLAPCCASQWLFTVPVFGDVLA